MCCPPTAAMFRRLTIEDMDAAAVVHPATLSDLPTLGLPVWCRDVGTGGLSKVVDRPAIRAARRATPWHWQRTVADCPTVICSPGPVDVQCNRAARLFYAARGFRLILETDGARNEEKEPDALYRW